MSLKYRTSAGTSASNFTDLVVKVGDTLPIGAEVDYDGQSVPAGWQEVDETNLGDVVVDSIRTKNMFDLTPVVNGTSYIIYYPVNVKTNTNYTVSTNDNGADPTVANVFFLTTNSGASSVSNGVWTNRPRTINSGSLTKLYIGIRGFNTSTSWVQMEEGNTATPYTPYQELNNQEVYSTGETRIGIWYNGKPIYRKVYEMTLALPTQVWTDTGITDISPSAIINAYAYYFTSNTMAKFEVNANKTSDGKIQLMNLRNTDVYPTVIVLEYTKITD